jgi:hypothetical protein
VADQDVKRATVRWVQEGRKFPAPAQIRDMAVAKDMPEPDEALHALAQVVRSVGYCREARAKEILDEYDPGIWPTMESVSGSWERWCSTELSDIPSRRARFVEFWEYRQDRRHTELRNHAADRLLSELTGPVLEAWNE